MKCLLVGCNKKARKKFCSNIHKDRYHNMIRYGNNDRSKLKANRNEDDDEYCDESNPLYFDYCHPFSSDGLGQD